MTRGITPTQFREGDGVEDWRVVAEGACAFFRTGSLAESARLVSAISALAGDEAHRPDFDLRPGGVTVRLVTTTPEWYGTFEHHVEQARQISAVARGLGLQADPSPVQSFMVIVEALRIPEVLPFWRAILGYEERTDSPAEDLVDPRGRGPALWFEQMDAARPQRNRMHVAVWVPYEQAEARVAAAIAAGGRVVFDKHAPAWWTLADPEGNEADVATTMARD